ncbi:MAG: OmpA family protein [Bacteroidaceae bacterium]|nr:OmpA family protein [Bacteroidaceae bacterium]
MRRFYVILMMLAVAMTGFAQQQKKWKAPKHPKRPKWEAPKQVAPEVINVWRPYSVSDNWFLEFGGGTSLSMAENTADHGVLKMCQPLFDFGVGKQFSKVWSTRLNFGFRRQRSWASKEALAVSSLLGDGDYCYNIAVGYLDEMMSLTNLFCRYNERRILDVQMFLGVGVNYSWNFEDKTERWERYGYPIDGTDHLNLGLRAGLQCLFKVDEAVDISLQGAYNMVGDSYNGVKHATGFSFDPYVDVSLGIKVHLMDHYGNNRYYKVRRWEATALRTEEHKVSELLDAEKEKEYRDREASEVVAFGKLMKTRISFYIDRSFVNDYQMENLRIVADFLKKHPEVNLLIKGYCGASLKSESHDMHLAERRVESVRKALVKYYNVDESRFETTFDEDAQPPFLMKGEWIDGVVFQMVEH